MPYEPSTGMPRRQMQSGNMFGIDSSAADYAGRSYEALTRSMWDSYVSNFIPYENRLIDYASDPAVVSDAMAEASGFVEKSFGAQQAATGRRLRGLGLTLDADEQKASDRSFGLSKSLADVTAQNVAGQLTRQRQQGVLGNPAPSAPAM